MVIFPSGVFDESHVMCRGALHRMRVLTAMLAPSALLSGCTSYSSLSTKPRAVPPATPAYSIDRGQCVAFGELTLVLAFSGVAGAARRHWLTACWRN